VELEIRDLVAGTFLENAPISAVSAHTGQGIPELKTALEHVYLFGLVLNLVFRRQCPASIRSRHCTAR
jgi:hypothetical protein